MMSHNTEFYCTGVQLGKLSNPDCENQCDFCAEIINNAEVRHIRGISENRGRLTLWLLVLLFLIICLFAILAGVWLGAAYLFR